jgi:hypothetical protein
MCSFGTRLSGFVYRMRIFSEGFRKRFKKPPPETKTLGRASVATCNSS